MTFYPSVAEPALSEKHEHQLITESAIALEIIQESGVRTITRGRDLPKGFSARQRRRAPGMLFPVPRLNGETAYSFRPDNPDPSNPGHKYEQPSKHHGGPGNVLGIYTTGGRGQVWNTSVSLVFVEGVKKALSTISAARAAGVELVVVAISGVWNWLSGGAPIPDMLAIPVEGRTVTVLFDSDMLRNPNVGDATRRLAEHQISRGADVWITFLEDQPDGSKTGADDFWASDGTFAKLRVLTRRYDPADFLRIRLSRDKGLRTGIAAARRGWWAYDWSRMVGTGERPNSMRGHTSRDVVKVLIDKGELRGKVKEGVVEVEMDTRMIAVAAATSRQSVMKALRNLEADGLIEILEAPAPDKPRTYRLLTARATLDHEGGEGRISPTVIPGGKGLRAPRFRWSSPGRKARRGVEKETRRVRDNVQPAVEGVKRLGKIRGAVVDVLEDAGGFATIQELCEILQRSRPRDLRRRVLPMLEDAGIVVVEGDAATLAENWLERLEEARVLGGELEREQLQREKYRREQEAFRRRRENAPDPHYVNAGADGNIEDLRPVEAVPEEPLPEPEVSDLARAIRGYLDRSPTDACQPPGWIGNTLWALDLFGGKPAPAEVKAAIEELGGEAYLRSKLRVADGRAA